VREAAFRQLDAAAIRVRQAMGAAASADPDLRAILAYWAVVHAASAYLLNSGGKLPASTPNHHENLLAIATRCARRHGNAVVAGHFAEANQHRPLVHRARYSTPRVFDGTKAARVAELGHALVEVLAAHQGNRGLACMADTSIVADSGPAPVWIVYSRAGRPMAPTPAVCRDLVALTRGGHVMRRVVHRDHVAGGLELAHLHLTRAVGTTGDDASLVAQFAWMSLIAATRALLLAHRVDCAGSALPRDAARLEVAATCMQSTDPDLARTTRSLYARYHRLVAQGRYLHPAAVANGPAWEIFAEIWPVVAGVSERAQEVAGGFTVHCRPLTLPAVARAVLAERATHRDGCQSGVDLTGRVAAALACDSAAGGAELVQARA
jgi:hypothetical protein